MTTAPDTRCSMPCIFQRFLSWFKFGSSVFGSDDFKAGSEKLVSLCLAVVFRVVSTVGNASSLKREG